MLLESHVSRNIALAFPTEFTFLRCFFSDDESRNSQLDPAKPARQRQIPGPIHLPPRRHLGLHTAIV